ncbi:Citrate transporter [Botrimarina hoheduenensis]|uniref:Citrate transporter n=1 Tax=Botrimarina hoheduenensis TaxID=2528000 RepID=A0A5C5WAY9_9BACT|nr:Citrate transporter [Botrimarina hoheduenensis]
MLATGEPLSLAGGLSILTVTLVFVVVMTRRNAPVDLLVLAGVTLLALAGVVSFAEAYAGFASAPVLLIAALFAAAAGLRTTGALDWVGARLLGNAKTEREALFRLLLVPPVSAFVLNTPLVAMLAPVVIDWCRSRGVSPSRLLIPLSYLTILGGVITVIGTSTLLVCNAQLTQLAQAMPEQAADVREIGLFEITAVGLPLAAIGGAYLMLVAPRLLPDRRDLLSDFGDRRREYLVEMMVQPSCPLIGKSIEEAGLRRLPGLFLVEIDRGDEVITPVEPTDLIVSHDRMVFTGVVTTIADLERIPGLVPAADLTYEFQPAARTQRVLAEAVLSRTSPLIGRTVREANFRQRYNAAIVAVHRSGARLSEKIGEIRLEAGDTLLVQTRSSFVDAHRNNRDFFLVSQVGNSSARRHDRALLAGGLFLVLIAWLVITSLAKLLDEPPAWMMSASGPVAAIAVVIAMVGARCLTTSQARNAIDLQVLITIAGAMGLGASLQASGAATWLAEGVVAGVQALPISPATAPWVLLAAIYLLSMLMTEAITNVAVATIMIPLSVSVAVAGQLSPRPFIIAVAIAASLSFATPIGYQTNLMVMGPGGYQPRDYLRVGGPMTLILATVAITLIGMIWGF